MKKHLFRLMAASLVLMAGQTTPASAQDENFYIFLCIGQSNMVGQGEISAKDSVVSDHFLSLSAVDGNDGRAVGKWRKALPPLCRATTHLSLVDYFGRVMLDNLPERARVGVVFVAVDGCAIDLFDRDGYKAYTDTIPWDWMKNEIAAYGGNPYKRLIDMARLAQQEGVIKGILLHQGETDAYSDVWLHKVKHIYDNIISDLNLDPIRVPLVAGEVVDEEHHGICANANKIINRLPEMYQNFYVTTSKGCTAGPDNLHFDANGYRLLGQRYGMKMLQALGYDVGMHQVEVTEEEGPAVEGPAIEATIDEWGNLVATSDKPLDRVEVVSFSGEVVSSQPVNGDSIVKLNVSGYNDVQLVLVFYSTDGGATSIRVTE